MFQLLYECGTHLLLKRGAYFVSLRTMPCALAMITTSTSATPPISLGSECMPPPTKVRGRAGTKKSKGAPLRTKDITSYFKRAWSLVAKIYSKTKDAYKRLPCEPSSTFSSFENRDQGDGLTIFVGFSKQWCHPPPVIVNKFYSKRPTFREAATLCRVLGGLRCIATWCVVYKSGPKRQIACDCGTQIFSRDYSKDHQWKSHFSQRVYYLQWNAL